MAKDKGGAARKKFKYRDYGDEEVKKAANAKSSDFDSFLKNDYPFFKPRSGENNIRILPSAWEDVETWGSYWGIEIGVHYGIGADNSTYLCLKTGDHSEDCPMCQAASDADDDKERGALRMKKRELCLVIDRDNEKIGPQIWAMPLTLSKEISQRIAKIRKDGGGDIKIDNPDEGYDVSFNKEGEKEKTKYTGVEIARESSPLHENEKRANRWLALITDKPLPEQLEFHEEEYIEKILSGAKSSKRGGDDDDDDDDDEDNDKSKKKPAKGKKGKSKSDDDDDEDETEDEDDEESDDDDDDDDDKSKKGKSKSKSKKGKSKSDDDDEESEDEESDDDEDGDDEESDDDDDDDDKSKKGKSKSKKGKSKKSSDDDDDDDNEDEDDEGEEESDDDDEDKPKPKKGKDKPKAKKGKSKSDDDDETEDEEEVEVEDEEEDDDDDEDKPKKGGKSSASARAKERLEKLKKRRGGR